MFLLNGAQHESIFGEKSLDTDTLLRYNPIKK